MNQPTQQNFWRTCLHESAHIIIAKILNNPHSAAAVVFPLGGGAALGTHSPDSINNLIVTAAGGAADTHISSPPPPNEKIFNFSTTKLFQKNQPLEGLVEEVEAMPSDYTALREGAKTIFRDWRNCADYLVSLACDLVEKHEEEIIKTATEIYITGVAIIEPNNSKKE